jgi:hypothetical protein
MEKQMTDIEIVLKYQDTQNDIFGNMLYRKYEKAICMYAHKTYKFLQWKKCDTTVSFEDLKQDFSLYFFQMISKIDRKRIKKGVTFNFAGLFFNYMNAYRNVIVNKYKKNANCVYLDDSLATDEGQVSSSVENTISRKQRAFEIEVIHNETVEKFKQILQKKEKRIFEKMLAGKGYKQIDKYYQWRNLLKNKYMEFAEV